MRNLLIAALLMLCVGLPACAATAADEASLAKSFAKAFDADFELVAHRTARLDPKDAESESSILFEVLARRAGNFTLRCEWDAAGAKAKHLTQEYNVVIADAGAPRLHSRQADAEAPHPLACVGDSIVLAFAIPVDAKDVRFFRDPVDADKAKISFDYEKEASQTPKSDGVFPVQNDAAAHFSVESKQTGGGMSESGSFSVHSSQIVLEAKKPGRFNLAITPKDRPGDAKTVLPVLIVPRGQALPVLAVSCKRTKKLNVGGAESFDQHELKTLVMRVGDRVSVACDGWTTCKGDPPAASEPHAVRLSETRFDPKPGSFGFLGLPNAHFAGD